MITVLQAINIVRKSTRVLEAETVNLCHARGRILAEDIVADSDMPPFDRSQMDGYAVRASDVEKLPTALKICA